MIVLIFSLSLFWGFCCRNLKGALDINVYYYFINKNTDFIYLHANMLMVFTISSLCFKQRFIYTNILKYIYNVYNFLLTLRFLLFMKST